MSVPKRFGVLRLVGTLLKVIAWIVLIILILGAIVLVLVGNSGIALPAGLIPYDTSAMGQVEGIVIGLGLLVIGLIYFLVFYAAGKACTCNWLLKKIHGLLRHCFYGCIKKRNKNPPHVIMAPPVLPAIPLSDKFIFIPTLWLL
ncbi:MAG: hypothetical protein R2932_05030 [Caldilineaceae bacterium]